jgi:signal transduction histidine kinase
LADVALLVALYTVALESEWRFVGAAVVILETGVVMATVRWNLTDNNVQSFVFLTGLVFTALLAGVVVRALRSQLDWLAERAERLELERDQQASLAAVTERARIAREMHDVVSHNIQVMVTLADAASLAQASDPARAAEAIGEVSSTGRQALTDMRRMLGVLREEPAPAGENRAGATGNGNGNGNVNGSGRASLAPQPGLRELDALVERVRGTGLDVAVLREGVPFEVSSAAGLTVYRVVQEALTNALKHAQAPTTVEVRLAFADPDVSVRVTDDGGTTETPHGGGHGSGAGNGNRGHGQGGNGAPAAGGGHGLAGMAERTTAFGGTLIAGPRATGGWEVEARLRDCKAPAPA